MTKLDVKLSALCPEESTWLALQERVHPLNRFLTRSWYTAWASAYLPMDRWIGPVSWLVARDQGGDPLALIPIARQRLLGLSVTSLGGYYWPFRGIPMISGETQILQTCGAIGDFLSARMRRKVWRLGPVPRNDAVVGAFLKALAQRGWLVMEKKLGETHAVSLPADFAVFEKEVGHNLLKSVAYYERRLKKLGHVEIVSIAPVEKARWLKLLAELAALEGNSWVASATDGVTKFTGSRNRQFWEEIGSNRAMVETLEVWMLYVDGKPVSYSLNINVPSTKYILANGYDNAFKDHSPGTVLVYHVLRDAARRGATSVEWGLGDSGYKSRWNARPNLELCDFIVIPGTYVGKLMAALLSRSAGYAASMGYS